MSGTKQTKAGQGVKNPNKSKEKKTGWSPFNLFRSHCKLGKAKGKKRPWNLIIKVLEVGKSIVESWAFTSKYLSSIFE